MPTKFVLQITSTSWTVRVRLCEVIESVITYNECLSGKLDMPGKCLMVCLFHSMGLPASSGAAHAPKTGGVGVRGPGPCRITQRRRPFVYT